MLRFLPALLMLLAACQAPSGSSVPTAAPASATAVVQWSGAYGGANTASHRLLNDAAAWNAFWREVGRDAPRPLDAARERAVAIFIGERRTGGYAVEILSTAARDGNLVVTYRENTPPPGVMVTQALTAPWVVTVLPKSSAPVVVQAAPAARPAPATK